jgi:hypothetical protein
LKVIFLLPLKNKKIPETAKSLDDLNYIYLPEVDKLYPAVLNCDRYNIDQ